MTHPLLERFSRISTLILLLLLPFLADSQLVVSSVATIPITCPNNGIISITATTSNPPLLYSIISGPVTQPVQTNPTFTSLLPGSYTVKVSDGAGNETTVNAIITGTYQNPDFTISDTTPYCIGQSNGKLVGQALPGKGLAPFTWQLVPPSPVTTAPQSSPLFENLPAGNYAMRISDACGSFSTNAIVLQNPNTQFSFYSIPVGQPGEFTIIKIGCDSVLVTYWLDIQTPRMPLTFEYNTPNGVFIPTSGTTIDSTFLHTTGQVMVSQIIPGADYGDQISAVIFNSCGDSAFSIPRTAHPFVFYPRYSFNNCGSTANVTFANTPYQDYHTSINTDATYTFTQVPSGTVIESGTITALQNNGIVTITPAVTSGQTYQFTITDGCGQTFQDNFTVPGIAPPVIVHEDIISAACIDSVVGTYRILTAGFGTNARLIMLSGPSTLGSTKPEFEYSDIYLYPDTLGILNGESFLMNNLAAGTYHFKIIDDCGNEIVDSIVITPQQVTSLKRVTEFEKGCPNHNKIFFSMVSGGNAVVKDLGTNTILADRDFDAYTDNNYAEMVNRDSVINLPHGTYEVTYQYLQLIGALENGTALNENQLECWKIVDTITIEPYEFPEMMTENVIMCNNTINFVLIPDSTKGVQPYEYEIISGPQTFPVQSSNIFVINAPGTYVARIYDVCGNASIKQITVDTISFDPISVSSSCSSTSLTFPSSLYFTYEWVGPDGQVFVGDSLILDPVTAADTGIYQISKIININGCIDTLHTTYHVTIPHFFEQTIPFCQGTTVTVGGNTYNSPGIYNDTLVAIGGCDSIVVTHLAVLPQNSDTTDITICVGDSLEIGGQFYDLPGFYTDSVQNAGGCYDLLVTNLIIHEIIDTVSVSICPGGSHVFGGISYSSAGFYNDTLISVNGCDSVSVLHLIALPYIYHSVSVSICQSQTYNFGGNQLSQPGIYTDTLSTQSCDSIVTLTLTVLPYIYNSVTASICQGSSFSFGGIQISQPGTYIDTLAASGCDSIVTLTLTVAPYIYNSVTATICEGDNYMIGGNTYTQTGTYIDTLATTTCDSIVTVTLIVLPLKHNTIYATICSGEDYPFGGTHYVSTGVYTHPFPTTTCDSIVTLHLTVTPSPSVNITSTAYETSDGIFVQLNAISGTNPLDYSWSSDAILNDSTISNPTTTITDPTWVYVIVTDTNGCTATDSYLVGIPVTSTLYIPNSFTPNGDEHNQLFRIYGSNIAQFHMEIYDRWGELIFESTDINYGWDATYKGKMVQDGTYVYKVMAIGMDYVTYDKTGHVTVLK